MNHLYSTYENLVKKFQFGKAKRKRSDSQIEVVDWESFLKKHERRLYQVQSIVFWESPVLSFGITLVLTLIFYFLSYCTWKLFASLFSVLLLLCVGDLWVDRIWPEIAVESPTSDDWLPVSERSWGAAELGQKMGLVKETLDRYWKWLINLRRDKPSLFCLSTSCILCGLVLVTWSISGLTLLYLSLLGFLCCPALLKRAGQSPLLQEYFASLLHFLGENNEEEEKIIPDVTEDTKKFLDVDTCESPASLDVTDSLDLDLGPMPSHEEVCLDGTAGLEEFALTQGGPAESPEPELSATSSSASLVSDAASVWDQEDQEYPSPSSQSLQLGHLISTMSKSLLPGGGGQPPAQLRKRRSPSSADEDSEFEMVEHDDVTS